MEPTKELEVDENGFVDVLVGVTPEQGAALMNFLHLVPKSEILNVQEHCGNNGGQVHGGLVNMAQALLEAGFSYQNENDERTYQTRFVEHPDGSKRPAVDMSLHDGVAPEKGVIKLNLTLTDDEAIALLNFIHLIPPSAIEAFPDHLGDEQEDIENALLKVADSIKQKGFQYQNPNDPASPFHEFFKGLDGALNKG